MYGKHYTGSMGSATHAAREILLTTRWTFRLRFANLLGIGVALPNGVAPFFARLGWGIRNSPPSSFFRPEPCFGAPG